MLVAVSLERLTIQVVFVLVKAHLEDLYASSTIGYVRLREPCAPQANSRLDLGKVTNATAWHRRPQPFRARSAPKVPSTRESMA